MTCKGRKAIFWINQFDKYLSHFKSHFMCGQAGLPTHKAIRLWLSSLWFMDEYELRDVCRKKKQELIRAGSGKMAFVIKHVITRCQRKLWQPYSTLTNKSTSWLTKKKYFLRRIVNLSSGIMWFPLNVLRFQKNQIIAQPLTRCILIQGLWISIRD